MTAKAFAPERGIRSFVIMKRLARSHARTSHPPLRAHFSRILKAFPAGHVIVCIYPPYSGGKVHTITDAVKAATHDASSRDGTMQVIFRRPLSS